MKKKTVLQKQKVECKHNGNKLPDEKKRAWIGNYSLKLQQLQVACNKRQWSGRILQVALWGDGAGIE